MLDALWIDIRHSLRGLHRSPGFSLVVIATVALAIAANTAIFSLLNAIVLRTVPVSDPDRLVAISTSDTQTTQLGFIYADTFTAFRAQQRSFATLSMYTGGAYPRIDARGATVYAGVESVTPEYFALVGARLAAGVRSLPAPARGHRRRPRQAPSQARRITDRLSAGKCLRRRARRRVEMLNMMAAPVQRSSVSTFVRPHRALYGRAGCRGLAFDLFVPHVCYGAEIALSPVSGPERARTELIAAGLREPRARRGRSRGASRRLRGTGELQTATDSVSLTRAQSRSSFGSKTTHSMPS